MYREHWGFWEIIFLSRREENERVKIGSRLLTDASLVYEHMRVGFSFRH